MSAEVIKLNTNEVYDQIERFFAKYRRKSINTEREYRRDINDFFEIVRNLDDVKFITKEQLQVTLDDFEDFINVASKKLKGSTVNRKTAAVKSLLKYLHAKKIKHHNGFEEKIVEDISYFSEIEKLKHNSEEYGVLEIHEVYDIADIVGQEKDRGEEKFFAVLLSLDTSIRISALLKLKWSNFIVRGSQVFLTYEDKGNKEFRREISKKFYDELLSIKQEGRNKLFSLNTRTFSYMMDRALDKLKIDENRNITWHSIRKTGGTYCWNKTGDILEVQKMLGHSNLGTTQRYLAKKEYSAMGAVSDRGNYDDELYKKVDQELLLEAISNLSKSQIYLLNEEIKRIQDNK